MSMRKSPALFGAALLTAALAVPAVAQEPTIEILAEGLNNPRGVSIAADGSIYVAEAGVGGDACMGEGEGALCFGPSGSVTRVTPDGVEKVVEGLPSAAAGPEASGISDVAIADDGTLYLITNLGADPAERESFPPELGLAGWLVKVGADGAIEQVADVSQFEADNDPDAEFGGLVDSNPYGITLTDGGVAVADAGGNDLLLVADDGSISLVAVFPPTTHEFSAAALEAMGPPPEGEGEVPAAEGESAAPAAESAEPAAAGEASAPPADAMVPIPVESVPTSVVVGPDGALYVGELTGGPFPVGGASVWRVAEGEEPTQYATGFTNILGLDFGPDGTLYVAEMVHEGLMTVFAGGENPAPPVGAVLSVAPGGGEPQVVATGEQLLALGGLAVDADGAIYVSTGTILGPGAGTLVKITP